MTSVARVTQYSAAIVEAGDTPVTRVVALPNVASVIPASTTTVARCGSYGASIVCAATTAVTRAAFDDISGVFASRTSPTRRVTNATPGVLASPAAASRAGTVPDGAPGVLAAISPNSARIVPDSGAGILASVGPYTGVMPSRAGEFFAGIRTRATIMICGHR